MQIWWYTIVISIFAIVAVFLFIVSLTVIYKYEIASLKEFLKNIINTFFKKKSAIIFSFSLLIFILAIIKNIVKSNFNVMYILVSILMLFIFLVIFMVVLLKYHTWFSDDFIMDEKLNVIRNICLGLPIFHIYFIFILFNTKTNLNKYIVLCFIFVIILQMIVVLLLISFGIKKSILDKKAIMPKRKGLSVLETKILIIITWFVIIYINAIAMIYITIKLDPEAFNFHGIINSTYFALVTILTIGFGDKLPTDSLGKIVVCIIASLSAYLLIVGVAGILGDSNGIYDKLNNKELDNSLLEIALDSTEIIKDKDLKTKQINEWYKLYAKGAITKREYKKKKRLLLK
ncbi:two pore domain potassium channel family protein [Clostridium sp. FP1]|uniref:two pore domain potassium channel family protein n=1 Tax=Clostridium sp. FP1 TaxID=2724076 RepID=UPI0013E92D63|nr:two pore domain potassium channel family protein [Clostridium sp. FP1]MBZ9635085.1 hypothetical protein [Clostridium sp. FP1]